MRPTIDGIKDTFNKYYPNLKPTSIFSIPNGYLVIAPSVESGEDYGDPNYFVDSKLTKATIFDMKKINLIFKAFSVGPIWKK